MRVWMIAMLLALPVGAQAFSVDDKTANTPGNAANYVDPDEQENPLGGIHYNITGDTGANPNGAYFTPGTGPSTQPCNGAQPCPDPRWR